MRALEGFAVALALASLVACDEKKETPAPSTAAPVVSAAPPSSEAARPSSDRPIVILVDAEGTQIGGDRATGPEGPRKMRELVAKLEVKGKMPTVLASRTAKATDVQAVVAALAAQGVTEVAIRTPDRSKKDSTRAIVPDTKAGKLADCTVAAVVQKDRTTASWPIRGGVATKYAKGMAGPDLSMTLEGLRKQVAACTSTAMVLAGDEGVEWGLVFDISDRVVTADPPLKIASWVLAREPLVAGRIVRIGEEK